MSDVLEGTPLQVIAAAAAQSVASADASVVLRPPTPVEFCVRRRQKRVHRCSSSAVTVHSTEVTKKSHGRFTQKYAGNGPVFGNE